MRSLSLGPRTSQSRQLPIIIQGGMGIGISNWRLARTVSQYGQLGVVSGTVIDTVVVRRLQDGDTGGHMRRAIAHFPFAEIAEEVLHRYFLPQGRKPGQPYKRVPMQTQLGTTFHRGLTMLSNFVEVFLAKEGHNHPVGINLLTKVQLPNLASLYGAMLAGVNFVLMGAGIPREIPGALDQLAEHQAAAIKFDVVGLDSDDEPHYLRFDPAEFGGERLGPLERPNFLPIIASNSLATMLSKKSTGSIQGFVIEGPTAGGHNAPPRGSMSYDELGQPAYGDRDVVDLEKIREIGLPFWVAGGAGSPGRLQEALAQGAAGIQVGTLFAYSAESGLEARYKEAILARTLEGRTRVFTDPLASPTGFPFKVVSLPGSNSEQECYKARTRVCDLGYLREAYKTETGKIGYRCASEPVEAYLSKGGKLEDTVGRKCLCNALMADIGMGQIQKNGELERPIVTSGDDLLNIGRFVKPGITSYSATEVVDYLLGGLEP